MENSTQNIDSLLVYDKEKAKQGRDQAFSKEINSAPRYNPFQLLETSPELKEAIAKNREKSQILNLLKQKKA